MEKWMLISKEKKMTLIPYDIRDKIKDIKNLSVPGINRLRIVFKNGYQLSIINGLGTYSDGQDSYEIAILDKYNNFVQTKDEDDVVGYCTFIEVAQIARKIALLEEQHDSLCRK